MAAAAKPAGRSAKKTAPTGGRKTAAGSGRKTAASARRVGARRKKAAPKFGKQGCHATTKAGKICDGPALTGSEFCMAHQPEEVRRSRGFGGPQEGSGHPPGERALRRRLQAQLEERFAQEFPELLEKMLDIAAEATRAVVVPGTRDEPGYVEVVQDQQLMLKAFDSLTDRVLGKAKTTAEITGPEGTPIVPPGPATRERVGQVADVLAAAGAMHAGRQRRQAGTPTNAVKPSDGDE